MASSIVGPATSEEPWPWLFSGDSEGLVFLWDGWGPFARADEQAFSVALSVLGTRVNADRGGPFAVLLRGDGPEVSGVKSLD